MNKKYEKSIFIFRRDLRLYDNTALIKSLKESEKVNCIFIFTPEQLKNNPYKSDSCVQFMIESLLDLKKQLQNQNGDLYFYYGKPDKVIDKIIKSNNPKMNIGAIYVNRDYTPYSIKRDTLIQNICQKNNVDFISCHDLTLNPICNIKTGSNTIYTKFTPYFNKAKKVTINKPLENNHKNYCKCICKHIFKGDIKQFYKENKNILHHGGRTLGLKQLNLVNQQKMYNKKRDCLNYNTTQLSAYIKFGCLSIREVYYQFKNKLGDKNDLIKQLYWRDFFLNIIYEYPRVLAKNLKPKYDNIKWVNNNNWFNKWCKGLTGFPIVDACMRQMNETGYMHNRGRLIVSNFLIKIMLIDWRKGEKYFAQTLYDYDVANNNGGWSWSSGGGADSQPYFRVFNPWLQSKKFDPKGIFIKKWIPELKDVDSKDLHKWDEKCGNYNNIKYPDPILDYKVQKKKAMEMYKKIF